MTALCYLTEMGYDIVRDMVFSMLPQLRLLEKTRAMSRWLTRCVGRPSQFLDKRFEGGRVAVFRWLGRGDGQCRWGGSLCPGGHQGGQTGHLVDDDQPLHLGSRPTVQVATGRRNGKSGSTKESLTGTVGPWCLGCVGLKYARETVRQSVGHLARFRRVGGHDVNETGEDFINACAEAREDK